MAKLNLLDKFILNRLQFSFPISERPFVDLADDIGMDFKEFINNVTIYKLNGLIKKVGFFVNYRSLGQIAALVGAKVKDYKLLAKKLASDRNVYHNYLRAHDTFNIWFTIKGKDKELLNYIRNLMREFKISNYIILKSVRTYKIDVKYELFRGISWSIPKAIPGKIPNVSELGISKHTLNLLKDLPLVERPFKEIASKVNLDEQTLVEIAKELIRKGILLDSGATLDGEKVGFNFNAMVLVEGGEDVCLKIVREVPEASHVIYREVTYGEWPYKSYFVIHGTCKEIINSYLNHIVRILKPKRYEAIYSIKNLKLVA